METDNISEKDAPNVPMIPPIILLLFLMLGIVLNWAFPMNWGHGWGWLGIILFSLGMGTVIWCKKLFDKAETNISPDKPTLTIVTTGPYKYSRNPIYAGFLCVYAGLGMMMDAPIMLLLTTGLWFILDRKIIVPEEIYLEEKFGEEYLDYKKTLRRWV